MDPSGLLRKMSDRLSDRLSSSRFFNFNGSVSFSSEVGNAELKISDGQVEVDEWDGNSEISIPSRVLTPIMTGYRGFERFRSDLKDITDNVADLLSVLFPRDTVYMHDLLYIDEMFNEPE